MPRIRYEIDAVAFEKDEPVQLPLTVTYEPGEPFLELRIGRGTEARVHIDELMAVLGRVDQERQA